MKIKKKFCWKVLTEDGLLKDHRPIGPYYSQDTFTDEFASEEEAVNKLIKWRKAHEYGLEREMVLVTTYCKVWE